MKDTKVVRYRAVDLYPSTPVVTHADYRALEENMAQTMDAVDYWHEKYNESQTELASLRARVGELVASVEAHESERVIGMACMKSWTDAQKDDHLDRMTDTKERRRLALEALK